MFVLNIITGACIVSGHMRLEGTTAERECSIVAFIITGFLFLIPALAQGGDDPWSVNASDPVIAAPADRSPGIASRQFEPGGSLYADFGYIWLRFYQKHLSSLGMATCPMSPSCSTYSILAIKKHGAAVGVVMTADRLIHEADEKRWTRLSGDGPEAKYLDPPENNDFWWYRQ